jgi:hypothetical protein
MQVFGPYAACVIAQHIEPVMKDCLGYLDDQLWELQPLLQPVMSAVVVSVLAAVRACCVLVVPCWHTGATAVTCIVEQLCRTDAHVQYVVAHQHL